MPENNGIKEDLKIEIAPVFTRLLELRVMLNASGLKSQVEGIDLAISAIQYECMKSLDLISPTYVDGKRFVKELSK